MLNAGQEGELYSYHPGCLMEQKGQCTSVCVATDINLYGNHSTDSEAAGLILYEEYFTFTQGLKRSCSNWANEAAPLLPTFTVALLTPSSSTHLKQKVAILMETIYNFKLNTFWNSKTKKPNIILFYTVPPRYESTICSCICVV